MALGALDGLRSAGRRVPDDVAVVGFDDSELARPIRPSPPCASPSKILGAEMGRLLIDQLEGDASPRGITLETELVVRRSA